MERQKVVELGGLKFQQFISPQQISEKVNELAHRIEVDYKDVGNITFIGVLAGATFFIADLFRAVQTQSLLDFIKVSSYSGENSTGVLKINLQPKHSLKGRNVIIVQDLIDTGFTLFELKKIFLQKGAASVQCCVICSKTNCIKYDILPKYIGFEVGDQFLVGYGMDFNQMGRNLRGIHKKIQ